MPNPHKVAATEEKWRVAERTIKDLYAAQGIPEALIPSRPLRVHDRKIDPIFGSVGDISAFIARARGNMQRVRFRAARNNQLVPPPGADVPEPMRPQDQAQNFQAWLKAMADQNIANINAQANIGVAGRNAVATNPALWQQLRAREMGPFADFFWNQFPAQMNAIGDTIGDQLNMNAQRVSAMTMARGKDAGETRRLKMTLAALEKIYGGFSGALESGFGSLGEGLGQWGQGFSPLGGASGAFGAGGGGGFRILPNGSVVTAQDFSGAIPEAGRIGGGQVNLGPIAGVNAGAANELGQMARGAGRQAAGKIRGQFAAKAAREGDAANAALMGAGARANLGQLGNALLVAGGTNKNILADAKAKATVAAAQNKARAARGKQFSGLVGKLGGLLPGLG
jgi:hypothetical protein